MSRAFIVTVLEKLVDQALAKAGLETGAKIERNNDFSFGDFSTNHAMMLAKKTGQNPKEIAKRIIDNLELGLLDKAEVAGAGFINLFLKDELNFDLVEALGSKINLAELEKIGSGKTLVIDYSSPNIAKPFGIGHLRSTNIGQVIYNLYKNLGWKTIGDNHIGDWGTQFGKLIVGVKKFNNKPLEELTISDLEKVYVEFHRQAETDKNLEEEGREWFAKLESGDTEAKRIWQITVEVSTKEHNKVYEMLGVKIDYTHGESFYQDMMPSVLEECKQKGISSQSQGAVIVELPGMAPAMLVKSNGTTTYFTRDLATISYRKEKWKPDLVVYEVGADQTLHFKQLFEVTKKMGWWPSEGMVHVAHGLIRWQDGKFSTRRGDTIHLDEVIEKAVAEAKSVIEKAKIHKDSGDVNELAKKVAISAIKFADLSSDPKKDIVFDWSRIFSLEGDSGPYVQYTYARCKSILENGGGIQAKYLGNLLPVEKRLLHLLLALDEKIIEAAERFSPSVICTYCLQLSRLFNEFYGTTTILGQPESPFRIFLVERCAYNLRKCMELLGMSVIEKM